MLTQAHHVSAHDASKPAVGRARLGEGLAAFQRAGQVEIRRIDYVRYFCYEFSWETLLV
jgi:hypothetical protein